MKKQVNIFTFLQEECEYSLPQTGKPPVLTKLVGANKGEYQNILTCPVERENSAFQNLQGLWILAYFTYLLSVSVIRFRSSLFCHAHCGIQMYFEFV